MNKVCDQYIAPGELVAVKNSFASIYKNVTKEFYLLGCIVKTSKQHGLMYVIASIEDKIYNSSHILYVYYPRFQVFGWVTSRNVTKL